METHSATFVVSFGAINGYTTVRHDEMLTPMRNGRLFAHTTQLHLDHSDVAAF